MDGIEQLAENVKSPMLIISAKLGMRGIATDNPKQIGDISRHQLPLTKMLPGNVPW